MRENRTEKMLYENEERKPTLEELWRESYGSTRRRRAIDFSGDTDDEENTESKDWYS